MRNNANALWSNSSRAIHTEEFVGIETHKNPNVCTWPNRIIGFNLGVLFFLSDRCKVCFKWTLKNTTRYMKLIEACPPPLHYAVSACEWVCRDKSHNLYSIFLLYSIVLGAVLFNNTCTYMHNILREIVQPATFLYRIFVCVARTRNL